MGVQEDGAGSRQPQQEQRQLQFKAHVQKEGTGEETQHTAVHGVLWGGVRGQQGACPTGIGGRTPVSSHRVPPGALDLSGDRGHRPHKHMLDVVSVCPTAQDGMLFNSREGTEDRSGEGDPRLRRVLTGTLMRGSDPGSSQDRLKPTEDTLGVWKGQSADAGKKNYRRR